MVGASKPNSNMLLHHVMSCHVMSCHVMSCHVTEKMNVFWLDFRFAVQSSSKP